MSEDAEPTVFNHRQIKVFIPEISKKHTGFIQQSSHKEEATRTESTNETSVCMETRPSSFGKNHERWRSIQSLHESIIDENDAWRDYSDCTTESLYLTDSDQEILTLES
jgi:hypothetical protein